MSYARTNPPRSVRPVRPPARAADPPTADVDYSTPGTNQTGATAAPPPRELQHRGAYAVKAPDPAKRDKIKQVADAEEQSYTQYKENRRQNVQYVTTNSSVGATARSQPNPFGRLSGSDRERSKVPPNAASSSRNLGPPKLKPPSLRSQTVKMEDPEIERRKAVQRQKAEALRVKQNDRQDRLDEERRRKNSQFLDRLEGKR